MSRLWTAASGRATLRTRSCGVPPARVRREHESDMTLPDPIPDPARDSEDADRRTAGLASIVVVLILLIGGLWLTHILHKKSVMEDCLMAGRRDCDVLIDGPR